MGYFSFRSIVTVVWLAFSTGTAFGQQTIGAVAWSPVKGAASFGPTIGMVDHMAQIRAGPRNIFASPVITATPFALGRPALRGPLGESSASANERKLLENVTKRVRLWREVEPCYP